MVAVIGCPFQYQLTESDIHKVFTRYGSVKKVVISDDATAAYVAFSDISEADRSVHELHDKDLVGLQGTLQVTWCFNPPAELWNMGPHTMLNLPALSPTVPEFVPGRHNVYSVAASSHPTPGLALPPPVGAEFVSAAYHGHIPPPRCEDYPSFYPVSESYVTEGTGPAGMVIRKYTCRFEIGIENDRDFHVARRIIGQKGANMKKIVRMTDAKLRLRGKGSGFLEGTQKQESHEPLHLCVSCREYFGYRTAIAEVKKLLEQVYDEYKEYCSTRGLNYDPTVAQVYMREHPLLSAQAKRLVVPSPITTAAPVGDVTPCSPVHAPVIKIDTPQTTLHPIALAVERALKAKECGKSSENSDVVNKEFESSDPSCADMSFRVCNG